jgi:hypothetical protein
VQSILRDAAKWASAPRGPHLLALRLHGRETATHPTRYRARYAQTRPLPLLRHLRLSLAKFPLMGRPPVTTLRRKDAHVRSCRPEPMRRLWFIVVSRHRCPPASALITAASVRFQSRPLSDEVLKQAAPLVELARLKARHLDPGVALPVRARSRVARVR